jgi:hypothetical protein
MNVNKCAREERIEKSSQPKGHLFRLTSYRTNHSLAVPGFDLQMQIWRRGAMADLQFPTQQHEIMQT